MGGSSANTKGSAGAVTNTVWFGALPDRLNMLAPGGTGAAAGWVATPPVPAHYANLLTLSDVTLGGFTTAPDGTTNTAQAITEDTSNGIHNLLGGIYQIGGGSSTGALRFAGFFKNNGRRVGFQVLQVGGGGIYAVFDLAGGQVGVAGTATGSPAGQVKVLNTQIIPQANGFYLCILDFAWIFSGGFGWFIPTIFLDNGTGTGALSNGYTGNGTSGVYGWRTNIMPVAAYSIGNNIFFDDFNDLSSIDVNNTKAPGFKWYVNNVWTNWTTGPTPQANWLSVNSSVLTWTPNNNSFVDPNLMTTVETTPGNYIGTTFSASKPQLWEVRLLWENKTTAFAVNSAFWTISQEWISALANSINVYGRELDFLEINSPISTAFTNTHFDMGLSGSISPASGVNTCTGTPLYVAPNSCSSGKTFVNGTDGIRYETIANVAANTPPPSAGNYSELDYPGGGFPNNPVTTFDYSQFHTYSFLIVPYWGSSPAGPNGFDATGYVINFCDGLAVAWSGNWGPTNSNNPYFQVTDHLSFPIIMSCDAAAPGVTVPMQFDFVRVMQ